MPKRILVAEDHPVIRRSIVKAITKAGFKCIDVPNGKDAVEAFESESFDLIILDGRMPLIDGFEAAKKIRSLEGDEKGTPIILHSDLMSSEVSERCKECGIDTFVPKSTTANLIAVMKGFL